VLVIPLLGGGVVVSTLAFATLRVERVWSAELVQRLRLLGEVFANALARSEAEAALRGSEERLRLIAESAPVMVWMSGPDGLVTHVNKRWLDFTGRRVAQELERGWMDMLHPDDRAGSLMTLHAARRNGQAFTLEYRLRRSDGVYRWLLDQGVPFTDRTGAVAGFIGSAVDVTPLKDAEIVVRESDRLRSAVLGSLYGQVAALDARGVVVAVNEPWTAFAERYEAARPAVSVGANYLDDCREAAASGDVTAARTLEAILTVLDGGRQVPVECAIRTPTEECWVEIIVEPFRRPEGGVVVSRVDVTRRRRAEEEARRQREELAHALRVTTLGELAGSIAHEINQPLAAIMTNAQAARRLLSAGRMGGDMGEVAEALADVVADTRRAGEVIHHLRALFRKEDGEREAVDINALVDGVVNLSRGQIERHGIVIRRVLAKDLHPVFADPVQIQQVLLNLLVNASEAIIGDGAGPGTIEIRTAAREQPDRVQIVVQDNGLGVTDDTLGRLFERFVSTKPGGLGMGLTISRSLVEAHGGRIWGTRNSGRGLTMFVELPASGCPSHPP
jgi:PAS domain S-box-containing protein